VVRCSCWSHSCRRTVVRREAAPRGSRPRVIFGQRVQAAVPAEVRQALPHFPYTRWSE
jgi:hypothetical protein